MPSGTAFLLPLVYGGLAVALAMDAFDLLVVLALRAVPLLVTLLATHKTIVVLVPTVLLRSHTSGIGTLA